MFKSHDKIHDVAVATDRVTSNKRMSIPSELKEYFPHAKFVERKEFTFVLEGKVCKLTLFEDDKGQVYAKNSEDRWDKIYETKPGKTDSKKQSPYEAGKLGYESKIASPMTWRLATKEEVKSWKMGKKEFDRQAGKKTLNEALHPDKFQKKLYDDLFYKRGEDLVVGAIESNKILSPVFNVVGDLLDASIKAREDRFAIVDGKGNVFAIIIDETRNGQVLSFSVGEI